MIGKTLSHYQVTNQIGKGGMGEVYRAKDLKLGRDVAIKVLPEEFARDADRVARFQREAKLLASLNHPNIATIHGLEESGGTSFLVLELVEGETLADQLKRGPIPVEESLKLALQIAEALEAAHEKGVIHRDLKPSNIKITPDGKVKVLDFGLAKAFAGDPEVNLSNSPTLSDAATQQGMILGTAAYMSPEQAKGKAVDKRADIWAFGVVLFEMLTGRQLFTGETVSETLAAVLKSEPEWKRVPPNLNPRIRFLLERCLDKEAKNRYGSINDARVEIQKTLADPSGVLVQPFTTAAPKRKLRLGYASIAAIVVLSVLIAGLAVWKFKPTEPRQVTRFDYVLPEDQQFANTMLPVLAVSPDGKQFVYSTTKGLFLRSVDELTAKLIAGTEGPTMQPFFSPDGKWIGYFSPADRKLKKIAINGGAPVALCDVAPMLAGASWNTDDTIVYGHMANDIMRVSANGGTPEVILKGKSEALVFPQILPGGKSMLYTAAASTSQFRLMVQPLKSGEPKELFAGGAARYLPTGHIVYALPNNNNLFSIPFDLGKLEVKGGPVPLIENVLGNGDQYAVSDAGTLVYMPGAVTAAAPGATLVWVDRNGKEEPLGTPPNVYRYPKISPDGTRLAVTISGKNTDIWIWDLVRKTLTRLTFDEKPEIQSIWTLDGKRIVFASGTSIPNNVCWKAADGTGEVEKIGSAPGPTLLPWSFSSDGKNLVMCEATGSTKADIGMMSMEGDHTRKPLLQNDKFNSVQPKISPDGRWIAYGSDESGKMEVYVRPFPEVNKGRWQISISGGSAPLWSPNGRELFYLTNENAVMATPVETTPSFSPGTPKILFQSNYSPSNASSGTPWDISPDGKRFLMIKLPGTVAPGSGGPLKINIVLNWFEELKQRVPVQ
jgi:serine/threonine protein kinase/Tol biopolymer transport system component